MTSGCTAIRPAALSGQQCQALHNIHEHNIHNSCHRHFTAQSGTLVTLERRGCQLNCTFHSHVPVVNQGMPRLHMASADSAQKTGYPVRLPQAVQPAVNDYLSFMVTFKLPAAPPVYEQPTRRELNRAKNLALHPAPSYTSQTCPIYCCSAMYMHTFQCGNAVLWWHSMQPPVMHATGHVVCTASTTGPSCGRIKHT